MLLAPFLGYVYIHWMSVVKRAKEREKRNVDDVNAQQQQQQRQSKEEQKEEMIFLLSWKMIISREWNGKITDKFYDLVAAVTDTRLLLLLLL